MKYNVFTFWQNLDGSKELPPYIGLCIDSMKKHCPAEKYNLHVLNYNNLHEYLPEIREDLFKIEYDWTQESNFGKKPKSVSEETMNKRKFGIISDYIRIALLVKFGGLWTDADHIFLKDPEDFLSLLETKDFIVSHRGWKTFTICNAFIASAKNGIVITAWKEMLDEFMDTMKDSGNYTITRYASFGELNVMKVIKKNMDNCCIIQDKSILPISCKKKVLFAKKISSIDLYKELYIHNPLICGIWNAGLNEDIKKMKREELLNGDLVISEIYRKALGITRNNSFLNLI